MGKDEKQFELTSKNYMLFDVEHRKCEIRVTSPKKLKEYILGIPFFNAYYSIFNMEDQKAQKIGLVRVNQDEVKHVEHVEDESYAKLDELQYNKEKSLCQTDAECVALSGSENSETEEATVEFDESDYKGKQDVTFKHHKKCLKWSTIEKQKWATADEFKFVDIDDAKDTNYCRNPGPNKK